MFIKVTTSFTFLYPEEKHDMEKFACILDRLDDGNWTGDYTTNAVTYTHTKYLVKGGSNEE